MVRNKSTFIAIIAFCLVFNVNAEMKMQDEKANIGWQFYNLPEKKKEKPKKKKTVEQAPQQPISHLQRLQFLQKELEESKAKAILNPTVDNVAEYKVRQDYFVQLSTEFSSVWEAALLKYPQLDYNLKNSFYNATAPIKAAEERKAQSKAIQVVNQQYGVFFFYRGNEAIDNKLAEVVKGFSEQYNLSIVPISIDGKVANSYPKSRFDEGQAQKMGVKYFPAIYLVNPKKNEFKPLAYGFITQDDLARRVLNVLTNFKPRI